MNIYFLRNRTSKFNLFIAIMLSGSELRSEPADFIVNSKKPVDILAMADMLSIWSAVKIDYPSSTAIFSYSCKEVNFGVFDLKEENKYVVVFFFFFSSDVKLNINGKDASKRIEKCYLSHTVGGNKDTVNRLIGVVITLDESESCDLLCNGVFNTGSYNFKLSRNANGWWTGSAAIQDKTRRPLIRDMKPEE